MKTAKLCIGIVSIILSLLVLFQSCAAGLVESMESSGGTSGAGGFLVAICLLAAGIIGIATRTSKGGGITAGVIYAFGSLIGFANGGVFADLVIWSVLSLIFAIVFLLGSLKMPKQDK